WRGTRFFAAKESAHRWLHAENLKKVANDFITGGRVRLAPPRQHIRIIDGECLITSNILIDAAHRMKFFVSICRVGGARKPASTWRRRDPNQFMSIGKRQWTQ